LPNFARQRASKPVNVQPFHPTCLRLALKETAVDFWGRKTMRLYHIIIAPAVLSVVLLAQSASAKCVSRTIARADGGTETIMAVAPDGGSGDLDAAGYKDTSCGTIDKDAYREKVCNPKAWGNSGVQRQLEIQAGITFAQLCSAARVEAGLSATPPDQDAATFFPSNRRPSDPKAGPDMVGPLGVSKTTTSETEGN
jgi:hypothetical protein